MRYNDEVRLFSNTLMCRVLMPSQLDDFDLL